ncbi:MAG: response regulator [Erythrobacter sp.]|nr:response regulator [Erythrobacter sp.]
MAHVLVVDDDDILAEYTARLLIDAGHACGWVTSVRDARLVLARRNPDLLLLDQNLPGENGSVLLRWLRQSPRFFNLPVIMLTASLGAPDEDVAYYNGAQDYIRKPFDDRMLIQRVDRILRKHDPGRRHATLDQAVRAQVDGTPRPHAAVAMRML